MRWFTHLGVKKVASLPLVDHASAAQPSIAAVLRNSRFIYLLGGFPYYLGQTLAGSLCWQATVEAYQAGAVIAGSSAGAMVLCQHYYDPDAKSVVDGLNLVPNACIIPHHNTFGKSWASFLAPLLPEGILIGIDEQTGMIDDGPDRSWNVFGKGSVTLYRKGKVEIYSPGKVLFLMPG